MKISKKRWSDLLWVLALVILLFTPLGKTLKVYINRLIAFSPSVLEQKESVLVKNVSWQLQSLESGKFINLNTLKGKVIFINQWATWCPPCLAEMPEINDLYRDYKDKVTFLMISSDDKESIKDLMIKENYHFINYKSQSHTPKALQSNALPQTFVIDKSGYIRVDKIGAAKWNSDDFRAELDQMINE